MQQRQREETNTRQEASVVPTSIEFRTSAPHSREKDGQMYSYADSYRLLHGSVRCGFHKDNPSMQRLERDKPLWMLAVLGLHDLYSFDSRSRLHVVPFCGPHAA